MYTMHGATMLYTTPPESTANKSCLSLATSIPTKTIKITSEVKNNSWRTINEKPCNLVRHKTTERYLTNQQKGIDAMVGHSLQPTSGK